MKNLEWTERELEILKEHYPSMSRGVVALLPGRTETACKSMAAKLNLVTSVRKRPVGKKWTEEEIKILKEVYPKAGAAGVHNLLPNRSVTACRAMAIKHGVAVYHTKWSDEEIEILKSNYHKLGQDVAELLPGRNIATCQKKAGELGLTSSNFYWTTEEDAILRTYYPKEGKLVSRRFPNRSQSSCISRAQKLGLYIIKSMDDHAPPISGSNGHGQSTNEARPDGVCSRETAAAEVDENQQEGGILPPSEMTLM